MPDCQIFKYSKAQMITEFRAGNINVHACLAFRYLKILSRYAYYFTRNTAASEILATRALEQLWEHRRQMQTPRCVHRFLHRQIYQEVCNWMRQQIIEMEIPNPPSFKNIEKP